MIVAVSITDLANIATLVSLPLTILTWLLTRERFTTFWKKWFKWILPFFAVIALAGLWRLGYLHWLRYRLHCPLWLFMLMPFSGVLVLILILLIDRFFDRTPSHFSYVSDNILGVHWQWRWRAEKIDPSNLVPLCPDPACSCRLDPEERSGYAAIENVSLVCDHCGFKVDFDCNWDDLRWKVVKEIDRRIRTEKFRESLQEHG